MASKPKIEPARNWPRFEQDEIGAVVRVLESGRVNYWTGNECREFEQEFADYHGVKHGIALANGTLALELALRVLGIGGGDEVIVTPRSFFASASCIALAGATPVFADVDHDSQNITPQTIRDVVTEKTKAIIAVHLAGWPCDMPEIMSLANDLGLYVIEDCAQAHGAEIGGQRVGSFGHVSAFSFCQDKIMTTAGEGGMLLTNDRELWSEAWSFKDHGKSWDKIYAKDHPAGFRWLHDSFGTNWRMTEIQGAIGRLQLRKLDSWIDLRTRNANHLTNELDGTPGLRVPRPGQGIRHANYKFYAFIEPDALREDWNRDRILGRFATAGIPALSGSCPEIYREAAFAGTAQSRLPVARQLGEQSMMLPIDPTIDSGQLDHFVGVIRSALEAATH